MSETTSTRDGLGKLPNDDIQSLDPQVAQQEIARLTGELRQANEDYHGKDAPTLSDADYDARKRRLAALEDAFPDLVRDDSPTEQVGAAPAAGFGKITHARRMMSLANAFDEAEI